MNRQKFAHYPPLAYLFNFVFKRCKFSKCKIFSCSFKMAGTLTIVSLFLFLASYLLLLVFFFSLRLNTRNTFLVLEILVQYQKSLLYHGGFLMTMSEYSLILVPLHAPGFIYCSLFFVFSVCRTLFIYNLKEYGKSSQRQQHSS